MEVGLPATYGRQDEQAREGTDDEDRALVLAAQRDPLRFAALYRKYLPRVYRYVFARAGTRAEAEDLTAEVFHRALRGLGQYRPEGGTFRGWLFRIAHNLAVDYLRGKREAVDLAAVEKMADTREIDPQQQALRAEERDRLREALRELPDEAREVIALRLAALAAALVLLGIVIGVLLPQAVTARPAASSSSLSQYAPIRPGWDDLAKVQGPVLFDYRVVPYKHLLVQPQSQTLHGVEVTVRDVILSFGRDGTALTYSSKPDGSVEAATFSHLHLVVETDNTRGVDVQWGTGETLLSVLAHNARGERLKVNPNISWDRDEVLPVRPRAYYDQNGELAYERAPRLRVPPGKTTWFIPLDPVQAPETGDRPAQRDAVLWFTPSLAASLGPFGDGAATWHYEFEALALDWEQPIIVPYYERWKPAR